MTFRRHHDGFTLVEVLMATAILATLSAGLLSTTWRLVGFARDEAERMTADNLAHDVMRAVYSMRFDDIELGDWDPCVFDPETALPQVVSTSAFGAERDPVCSLWRERTIARRPYFKVSVSKLSDEVKLIAVTVYWWVGEEIKFHSPPEQARSRFGDETTGAGS